MKLKWKEDAVSPVIATILMVAITVVLAAVLYVMVIGMGGSAVVQTPVGNWQDMAPITNHSAKITFGTIEPTPELMDLKIIFTDENGLMFNVSWPGALLEGGNVTLNSDDSSFTVYYHDTNPAGGYIGGGDYIEIYGLDVFTYYYVQIFHYPSDSIVQMAGKTSFQTLP